MTLCKSANKIRWPWQNLTLFERQMCCKALAQDQIYVERVRVFKMSEILFIADNVADMEFSRI
jgi:hypothetical protein